MKDRIDFIGIGCRKCATTSVFNALALHPLIIPPHSERRIHSSKQFFKECHYWERDVCNFDIGTYHKKYWGELENGFLYGEFSPDYIVFEDCLRMIHDYNPHIKLIALFRDPVERLWSDYRMFRKKNIYNYPFREFIDKYADLEPPQLSSDIRFEDWPLYASCYGTLVQKAMGLFDRKNLLFIKMEELEVFSEVIEKIFSFLGVHSYPVPEKRLNTSPSNVTIPFHSELLDRFFLKEIELLENLLDWDCSDWKEGPTKPNSRDVRPMKKREAPKLTIFGNHIELDSKHPQLKDIKFSICTGIKDRNELLVQALPSWLKLPAQEIVIVDWCSKQSIKELLAFHNITDGRIKVIRIKNEPHFNLSKVLNFSLSQTSEDFILKIDSDIIIKPKRIARHRVNNNTFYIGARNLHGMGTFGTIGMTREMFTVSNGYNERLTGWGFEDNDLYERLMSYGYSVNRWSKNSIKHINHPSSARMGNNHGLNKIIARELTWTQVDKLYQPEIEYIEII